VRQFPYTVPLLYIIFENSGAERHNAKRDYVHPRDRTARTEPKTTCPPTRLPRREIPLDNNSEQKSGEGANWGRTSGRERASARAAWPTILVRQDGSPVLTQHPLPILINWSLTRDLAVGLQKTQNLCHPPEFSGWRSALYFLG
jgi:hypothetical protein